MQMQGMDTAMLCGFSQQGFEDDQIVLSISQRIAKALFRAIVKNGGCYAGQQMQFAFSYCVHQLIFLGIVGFQRCQGQIGIPAL